MTILIPIVALSLLGLVSGILLGLAYEFFSVKEDPRVNKIMAILPGINCGACGYAGCRGFAEALLAGKASISGCRPGREKVVELLKEALK